MDEEWQAIEESVHWALTQEDAWLELVSESHRFGDSWTFWNYSFDVAIERRKLFLADQIMRDRIQQDEDFSAQPWLMSDYAQVLEALGRYKEALTAIRSAIEDLPHDEDLQVVERRLLQRIAASAKS
jgi:predicted Zn-dependent protease